MIAAAGASVDLLGTITVAIIIAVIGPISLVYVNKRKDRKDKERVDQEIARSKIIADNSERVAQLVADASITAIERKLDTGNGHTAGAGIANLEKDVQQLTTKFESLEEGHRFIREDLSRAITALADHVRANEDLAAKIRDHMEDKPRSGK